MMDTAAEWSARCAALAADAGARFPAARIYTTRATGRRDNGVLCVCARSTEDGRYGEPVSGRLSLHSGDGSAEPRFRLDGGPDLGRSAYTTAKGRVVADALLTVCEVGEWLESETAALAVERDAMTEAWAMELRR